MSFRQHIYLLPFALFLLSTASVNNKKWQQEPIYTPAALGLGEPIVNNYFQRKWDINTQLDILLKNKPSVFRLWMPVDSILKSNGELNPPRIEQFKIATKKLANAKVPILGMDHRFPWWMTGSTDAKDWNSIPCRDLDSTSAYYKFLEKYKAAWFKIAQTFPEIEAWEPANETNGPSSFVPIQVGTGSCGKTVFTFSERVLITLDLLYQAHYAIHQANPKAIVFLPPPTAIDENGNLDPSLAWPRVFIESIYQHISWGQHWSKNLRDYFDGMSWHPYIFQNPTHENWIKPNEAIYNVLVKYKDQNIPIIFSEVGNSEVNPNPKVPGAKVDLTPETVAHWMKNTLELSRNHMPWLKYIIWFRGFDDLTIKWGPWDGTMEQHFGMFKDSLESFAAKPSAQIFCNYTTCNQKPGWYKARVKSASENKWSVFYVNGVGQYCQGTKPDQLSQIPYLKVADLTNQAYVGNCK